MAKRLFPSQEVEEDDYLADILTDKSIAFIQANKDQPFFLTLSHYAVHIPLQAREALIQKYNDKSKPDHGVNNPIYAAMVEHVDESVGRMMQELKELGLDDNTLVVFFSDNGGLSERFDRADGVVATTNAPLRDEKGTLYEGGIRVPMMVRWPGTITAGVDAEVNASSVDLYPTFLDAAGIQPAQGQMLDGISLMPAFRQESTIDRPIFFHYPHYHHSTPAGAVRLGEFKLIEFYDGSPVELYNLAEDLGEKINLAEENPEKVSELQALLASWRESAAADMPVENPEFDANRRYEWGRHPDRP